MDSSVITSSQRPALTVENQQLVLARNFPQQLKDLSSINGTFDNLNSVMSVKINNLNAIPIKNMGQFLIREKAIQQAKNFAKPFAKIAKYTPLVNVAIGAADFAHAYNYDIKTKDGLRTESTRSLFGTLGNIALGATAVTTITALGLSALPAAALIVGAGYAGNAIGESVADGIVALKSWWRS